MRSFFLISLLFLPVLANAVEPNTDADTIGAEWNNSTSVEFPATSTDAEGNIIYNYYNDSQYFGNTNTVPTPPTPKNEDQTGEVVVDAGSQLSGNENAKNLFNVLGDVGGVTGSDESDFDFFGDIVNSGSLWNVVLSGSIIRDELKKKGVKDIVLKGFGSIEDANANDISNWLPKTKGDLSLVAAAAIIHDANIIEVHLTLKKFDIQYLAHGWLLYVIPWKYVIYVSVEPEVNVVSVRYPWYEWFLWKPVTRPTLETAIRDVVSRGLSQDSDTEIEKQARIFAAVADILKLKHKN